MIECNTIGTIRIQKLNPKLANPSDEYVITDWRVSVIPMLVESELPNKLPYKIIVNRHDPIATPFQIYKPKTLNICWIGLNATFIIENTAEITANKIEIDRKITVDSQNPRPINSSLILSVAGKKRY